MTSAACLPDGFRDGTMTAQDGLRLHFRDYGDPLANTVPLLCLSGLTRNAGDFHALARRQAARRRVLCPDYRGRGRSAYDPDWRNYQPRVYLRDVLHLLAAANLEKVVVCGTSLGAFLAMGMAVVAPTALAGVILNDAGPQVERAGLGSILDYVGRDRRLPDWASAVEHVKQQYPELGYSDEADWRAFARSTFRESESESGELVVNWDVRIAKTLTSEVPDLWPLFRALRSIPTLALRGERSSLLSPATFDRMAQEHPDLSRVTVPGVGHAPSLTEPEAARAIDEFLAPIDQRHGEG